MAFVVDLLTMPVLGTPRLLHWLARTLAEQAERSLLDEGPVRGQLLELQAQYDSGDLTEEAYDRQEGMLLDRLKAIREVKEQRARET